MNTLNTQTTLKGVDMNCTHNFKTTHTVKGGVFESPSGLLKVSDTLVKKCIDCNAIRHSHK